MLRVEAWSSSNRESNSESPQREDAVYVWLEITDWVPGRRVHYSRNILKTGPPGGYCRIQNLDNKIPN